MVPRSTECILVLYSFSAVVYVVDDEVLHEDKFAAIGENVTIPCYRSISKPVFWRYKNSAELNARGVYNGQNLVADYVNKCTVNTSTYDLTIHDVIFADAGEYWCTEDDGFGVKHVIKLFISGKMAAVVM